MSKRTCPRQEDLKLEESGHRWSHRCREGEWVKCELRFDPQGDGLKYMEESN